MMRFIDEHKAEHGIRFHPRQPRQAMTDMAFVIDVFSRRIVGCRVAASTKTDRVLDALEQAIWTHNEHIDGLVCHSDADGQDVSIRSTEQLAEIGAAPSLGSVGDPIDNAVANSTIGLYKPNSSTRNGRWAPSTTSSAIRPAAVRATTMGWRFDGALW